MFKNTLKLFVKTEHFQNRNASTIGFIGLGNMGARMANNLIKKGQKLKVYDIIPSVTASIQGATQCNSPEEASTDSSLVITMLPTGDIVKETLLAENGILKGIPKNSLLVDCSTIAPQMAQDLSRIAKENKIRYLDAPVSGGVVGAEAGTLTFMVGGEEKDVDEVRPILLQMGAKVHHCGNYGSGQIAKLCNNLILDRNASTIGFIGLGNMGARMANNLIKKGQKLKVYDIIPSVTASIQGATQCNSPEEASTDSSLVITMLPTGDIVKETLLAENGILKGIPKNSLLVDCSTIAPQMAQDLSRIAKENKIRYLDAPVSGGVVGAEAGTLTFMVGGEEKDVDEVRPILLQMGAKVHHCGNYGSGQIAKLCNNLILGITMIGTAEAMNLGIKLGLDPKLLVSIVNVSTGRSWSCDTYNPVPGIMENVPSSNEYKGGFGTTLIAKDLGLAENAALSCGVPLPLGALAHQLYRTMISNGYEDKDFSSIYQFLKGRK